MSELFHAAGFLYNPEKKEVLLHKRDGNTKFNPYKWSLFGGSSEEGEQPLEAFIREMKEELGITLQASQVKSLCSYFSEHSNRWRHVFYVISDTPKSEMILGEGEDFDWVPLEKIFDYDLSDKAVQDLHTFLKTL